MLHIPEVGDIVQIKRDLSDSSWINGDMFRYAGRTAKVTRVQTSADLFLHGADFAVHLNVDGDMWFWYPDAIIVDPIDIFHC